MSFFTREQSFQRGINPHTTAPQPPRPPLCANLVMIQFRNDREIFIRWIVLSQCKSKEKSIFGLIRFHVNLIYIQNKKWELEIVLSNFLHFRSGKSIGTHSCEAMMLHISFISVATGMRTTSHWISSPRHCQWLGE